MNNFISYDVSTGKILSSGIGQIPEGDNVLPGIGKQPTHYVDLETKQIVEKPVVPGFGYTWDYESKQWQQDPAKLVESAKQLRDDLLIQCDWTQLPDVPESTKVKWMEYRQALRDIPNQIGFPFDIKWPEIPR